MPLVLPLRLRLIVLINGSSRRLYSLLRLILQYDMDCWTVSQSLEIDCAVGMVRLIFVKLLIVLSRVWLCDGSYVLQYL
jgi:hypothetical protein